MAGKGSEDDLHVTAGPAPHHIWKSNATANFRSFNTFHPTFSQNLSIFRFSSPFKVTRPCFTKVRTD